MNPPVNRDTNLLSLINPVLANVYCSTILSNHDAIKLKRFVSQFTRNMCNWFFFLNLILYACLNI